MKQQAQTLMTEDWDGNIMNLQPTTGIVYYYNTGAIPAQRIENTLRVIVVQTQWHQALMQFHFACQGKIHIFYYSTK